MQKTLDYNSIGVDLLFEANIKEIAPKVSVHMITYGHEKFIVKAVSSVLEGTYDDYELIISDDASPDDTKVVLLEYLNGYKGSGQVRYVRHRKNSHKGGLGHGVVFNMLSRGSLIMSVDGDDWSCSDRLARTVALWDSLHPEPSIMVLNAYCYDDKEGIVTGLAHSSKLKIGEREYYAPGDPINTQSVAFGTATVLSRRFANWCRQFEEYKDIIAGDVVRVRRALLDRGIWFVNEPTFFYRKHIGSVSGRGNAGKDWIHDRLLRWRILESDYRQICANHEIPPRIASQLHYWIKRTELAERLVDCSSIVWPFLLVQYWIVTKSYRAVIFAMKLRVKLILFGDVNAMFKKGF